MNTQKKPPSKVVLPIAIRLPKEVIAKLDKFAEKNCRSRSAEIKSRLLASLSTGAR